MRMAPRRGLALLLGPLALMLGLLAGGCATTTAPPSAGPDVIHAVVTYLDPYDHYLVAEWPGGRTLVSLDPRQMDRYRVGSEIILDGWRRPLPP